MKKISIDPITRLEGHGKIEIFLNDAGDVENVYFQVPELRGFEKFCVGRPVEELPRIVTRICGVCPGAHHMASGKAVDAVYHADPPEVTKKLREMFYSAHYVHSHIAHFYALAAPDFVLGPDADPAVRNILGVVDKVGLAVGGEVIKHRGYGQEIQKIISGRSSQVVWTLPGGVSKGITEEERAQIEEMAKSCVEFSKFTLQLFDDVVLKNKTYVDLILSEPYQLKTYYMGMVDQNDKVNFYDGKIKVVDPEGKEVAKYMASEYLDYIAEHVEPWTYLKFPYLKKVGWKGFVDGKESGVYRAVPVPRLNVASGMATPLAQEAYEKYITTLGKPVHATLANHWARVMERMHASERLLELAQDKSITDPNVRIGRPRRLPTALVWLRFPRHPLPPLYDRQKRVCGKGKPDGRHHQQSCSYFDVHQKGGHGPDRKRPGGIAGALKHDRDGFQSLRPLLQLRYPFPSGADAHGSDYLRCQP